MSRITTPCIVEDMDAETYHGDPCPTPALSNSIIKPLITQSPYHAWLQHPRLNPAHENEHAEKFDLGSAAHSLLLEGVDNCEVIHFDDWRTNKAKEQREEARAAGKTPLLVAQFEAASKMVLRATEFIQHTEFAGVFQRGKPEASIFWEEMGIWIKARLDWLTDDRRLILDYKSTSINPRTWKSRTMLENGYDTQSLLYPRGLSVLGYPGARFVFLVQEVTPPYACWLTEPTESMRELAGSKIARAIRTWADCLHNERWPGYPFTVQPAYAPTWALAEEEAMQ